MTTVYEHKTELVGDDYTGLPIQPVKYRGKPSRTGIDWDRINEQYVANGGHVDDSVWTKPNRVELITGTAATSRRAVHTFELADDYQEHVEPRQRKAATGSRTAPKLTPEQRVEIGQKYAAGGSYVVLAKFYDVSVTTIRNTVTDQGIEPRRKGRPS